MTHTLDPNAVAAVTHPNGLPLATLQTAWDALKRDRGQTCDWDRLRTLPLHHATPAIRPLPDMAQADTVQSVMERCAGRAAARRNRRPAGYLTDGGAA